jgi:hypothetical protein
MRVVIAVVVSCLIISASSWGAAALQQTQSFSMSSVEQLRQSSLATASMKVNGPGLMPSNLPGLAPLVPSFVAAGDPSYRTGPGVGLLPTRMVHAATGSQMTISHVYYSPTVASGIMANSSAATLPINMSATGNPMIPIIWAGFAKLAYGVHTYALTLGLRGTNLSDSLQLTIGQNQVAASSMVIRPQTGEVHVFFQYDAGGANQGRLYVCGRKIGPVPSAQWVFHHVRLIQLN